MVRVDDAILYAALPIRQRASRRRERRRGAGRDGGARCPAELSVSAARARRLDRAPRRAAAADRRRSQPRRRRCRWPALSLLSPVANPGKLIAAPVNYQRHLDEVRANADLHHHNPIAVIQTAGLFLKATSSLAGAGEGVALRKLDRRSDHEVELAFVIGKRASRVARADALDYVAGYCIGLDITIRGPEERSLRKSVDSYSVLGPWLVTADEIPDPGALDLRLSVNGEIRQQSNTAGPDSRRPRADRIRLVVLHAVPGDVIFTGTPEGVGPIQPGDTITACIERIGTMQVAVRAAESFEIDVQCRPQRSQPSRWSGLTSRIAHRRRSEPSAEDAHGNPVNLLREAHEHPRAGGLQRPARSEERRAALERAGRHRSARAANAVRRRRSGATTNCGRC